MVFLRAGQAARDAGRHLLTGPRSRALEALSGARSRRSRPAHPPQRAGQPPQARNLGSNRYFPALSRSGGFEDGTVASRLTSDLVGFRGRAVAGLGIPSGSRRAFARGPQTTPAPKIPCRGSPHVFQVLQEPVGYNFLPRVFR
jgi:hypothetical protein